jgi:hypothetical protein
MSPVLKIAVIIALIASAASAQLNSISAGYGLWRATSNIDGFSRSNIPGVKANEFHSLSLSGEYKINDAWSLSLYVPYVFSVLRKDNETLLRNRITDLNPGVYYRFSGKLMAKLGAYIPTGYNPDGIVWLAADVFALTLWVQYKRGLSFTPWELLTSISADAGLTDGRTKAGAFRASLVLGAYRQFENGHSLKIGIEENAKTAQYGNSELGYNAAYTQNNIDVFTEGWYSINDKYSVSLMIGTTIWGYQSKAGYRLGTKITKKFMSYQSFE